MGIGGGLSCPVMQLFNKLIRGLLPKMNRKPINHNNDDIQYEALKANQSNYIKESSTQKAHLLFPQTLQ